MPRGIYRRTKRHRREAAKKATKHGGVGTPEHRAWSSMLTRCRNPNSSNWRLYGGRGIRVCTPWLDFPSFLSDMGKRPKGCALERIDSNKDYTPANCRWATPKEQANNRRNNRTLTHQGRTQTMAQWADECGLKPTTLKRRLDKLGWPLERALSEPVRGRGA